MQFLHVTAVPTISYRLIQVLPGLDAPPAKPEEVAKYTVRTIMRTTPAAVPGIHFLSGKSHRTDCNVVIAMQPVTSKCVSIHNLNLMLEFYQCCSSRRL